MNDDRDKIDAIVCTAVELASAEERANYIRRECMDDADLQQRVETLVNACLRAGPFLETPAVAPMDEATAADVPGATIGQYKLLDLIGEGGFAVVYRAEQQQPIRRRVAVKIVKAGMDTRQVIARFDAERQALAMMDHLSIAKIFDGGATEAGRPFFVMELVQGTPITEYCDEHRLSLEQRLELFNQVCDAVQHAHQKGIIHRDLKPSNVLVTAAGDHPLAKVIDFGIAKATESRLTDKTLFTDYRQLIGTPAYMSPEQAHGSLDIDTRSDIYSLGVLLYELLAGAPPFDPKELKSHALAEMQRVIREVEPPTPSSRFGALVADSQIAKAGERQLDAKRLASRIRGELDWIVMRCLEKDRGRRYPSAAALSDDIGRFLADQPVEAGPPSPTYRFRKFVRRNKAALLVATLFLTTLAGAAAVSMWHAVRASRAQREAEAISNFLVESFRSSDPNLDGRQVTIVSVLERSVDDLKGKYLDDPLVKAKLLHTLARTYSSLGIAEQALPLFKEAFELRKISLGEEDRETLSSMASLASNYGLVGQFDEAVPTAQNYVRLCQTVYGENSINYADALQRLSGIYRACRRAGESVPLASDAMEIYRATYGPDHEETLRSMYEQICSIAQANAEGHSFPYPFSFDTLYDLTAPKLGEDHRLTLAIASDIGYGAMNNGYYEYSSRILTDTLRHRMTKFGPQSVQSRWSVARLARLALLHVDPRKGMTDVEVLEEYVPDDSQVVAAREEIERRLALSVNQMADQYVTKIQEAKDELWTLSPRKSACRELAELPEVFDVVARRIPEETALWIGRGQYHLWRGRLAEAEADYAKVIDQRPLQDEHYEYACMLLARGDDAAYQAFCQKQFEQAGEPRDPYQAYLAARLYGVGNAKCATIEQLVQWAELAARERRFWQRQALALVYLRAGRSEDAIAIFRPLLGEFALANPENAQVWYGLAMAYHAQGKLQEGRRCLSQGRKSLATATGIAESEQMLVGTPSAWVLNLCYAREAEARFSRSGGLPPDSSTAAPE